MAKTKKKKIVEQNEEKVKLHQIKRQEDQIKWAVIFMIILILALVGSYFGVKAYIDHSKTFRFMNMKFEKSNIGYIANLPIKDVYGRMIDTYKFRFRSDPRTLNVSSVPIELTKGAYIDGETITLQGECEDGTLAGATLITYLGKIGMSLMPGTINEQVSQDLNITLVDCDSSKLSVIVLKNGDTSQITREGNCYILESRNCEDIMNVTEKFLLDFFAKLAEA